MSTKSSGTAARKNRTPAVLVIPAPFAGVIDSDTRKKLIGWLDDPVTRLALSIVEANRPPITTVGGIGVSNPEASLHAANNRLHELRGWELYRLRLLSLGVESVNRGEVSETFSNEPDAL